METSTKIALATAATVFAASVAHDVVAIAKEKKRQRELNKFDAELQSFVNEHYDRIQRNKENYRRIHDCDLNVTVIKTETY